jgi:hypothetical protein
MRLLVLRNRTVFKVSFAVKSLYFVRNVIFIGDGDVLNVLQVLNVLIACFIDFWIDLF